MVDFRSRGDDRGRDRDDRGSRDRGGRDDDRRGSSRDERPRDDDRRGSSRGDDRGSSRGDDRGYSRGRDDDRGSSRSSGSGSSFRYEGRTADDLKQRASMGANEFDKLIKPGIKQYKVRDGENRVRVLPPTWDKPKHYGYDLYVHYGVGPDRASYLDLDKMKGEPDPITEERARAKAERDPDEDYVKELDSKRRVGCWVVDRLDEREGVQFWAMPWTVDRDIVTVSVDRDTGEVLPVDDPKDGYDIIFDRTGKDRNTKYTGVSVARRSSPLGKPEWLDYAVDNPIPSVLMFHDYDTIAKAFGAKGAPREPRGDDRRPPADDRRAPRDDDRRTPARDERTRRDEPPAVTWESVHEMTAPELDDLIAAERLDIDPRKARDDEDLADWICDEMKLKKAERSERRREDDPPAGRERRREPDSPDDKMSAMRRRRED